MQNFPNPFNPTTTISYHLKESGTVELKIYNTLGKIIRTLVHAKRPAGSHEVVWDGRDDAGNPVPSGQYFVELQAGNAVSSRKLLLAK
ncbi:MAG TPA: T9SS type A sorting domain-containing protein [Bacteroidetes bacterium]|nr:T9SS type A sorting domain-containing protein [Bacteroidota bacterium]